MSELEGGGANAPSSVINVPSAPMTISIDLTASHNLSIDLLEFMESRETIVANGMVACLLSVGRLVSDEPLNREEEINWIKSAVDFTGSYFAGASN